MWHQADEVNCAPQRQQLTQFGSHSAVRQLQYRLRAESRERQRVDTFNVYAQDRREVLNLGCRAQRLLCGEDQLKRLLVVLCALAVVLTIVGAINAFEPSAWVL
jgi:hypothetical protein